MKSSLNEKLRKKPSWSAPSKTELSFLKNNKRRSRASLFLRVFRKHNTGLGSQPPGTGKFLKFNSPAHHHKPPKNQASPDAYRPAFAFHPASTHLDNCVPIPAFYETIVSLVCSNHGVLHSLECRFRQITINANRVC